MKLAEAPPVVFLLAVPRRFLCCSSFFVCSSVILNLVLVCHCLFSSRLLLVLPEGSVS